MPFSRARMVLNSRYLGVYYRVVGGSRQGLGSRVSGFMWIHDC